MCKSQLWHTTLNKTDMAQVNEYLPSFLHLLIINCVQCGVI
jgi:hypothetical protein